MVDHASEFEVVIAVTPAGVVQLVGVRLGTALQYVGLVADFELLWWCLLAMVAPAMLESSYTAPCDPNAVDAQQAAESTGTHTGVRPKRICGGFPLLMLSSSSSTMSWVISTCMACSGGSLSPKSPFGIPTRAMPPDGSIVVVMVGVVACRPYGEAREAWSSHPGMLSREAMHGDSTQARRGGGASNQRRREGAARHGAAGVWSSVGSRGVTESEQKARDSEDRQTKSVRLS